MFFVITSGNIMKCKQKKLKAEELFKEAFESRQPVENVVGIVRSGNIGEVRL